MAPPLNFWNAGVGGNGGDRGIGGITRQSSRHRNGHLASAGNNGSAPTSGGNGGGCFVLGYTFLR